MHSSLGLSRTAFSNNSVANFMLWFYPAIRKGSASSSWKGCLRQALH
jgi:hypothetical protein